MTVKPVDVLLDVDGVINALAGRRGAGGWGQWKTTRVRPYTITYAPELIARLNALAARDGVTFHWLTTWGRRAAEVLSDKIGLNGQDWLVVAEQSHASGSWWKHAAAAEFWTEPRGSRLVWVDDDLVSSRETQTWLDGRAPDVLWVAPDPLVGITREQMQQIEDWIGPDEGSPAVEPKSAPAAPGTGDTSGPVKGQDALPPRPETPERIAARGRYGSGHFGDSAEKLCRRCGAEVEQAATGRPRVYCGDACRRESEYAVRRVSALLHQAEKAEQMARLKLEVDASWSGATEAKAVAFWQAEIERLSERLDGLLGTHEGVASS